MCIELTNNKTTTPVQKPLCVHSESKEETRKWASLFKVAVKVCYCCCGSRVVLADENKGQGN